MTNGPDPRDPRHGPAAGARDIVDPDATELPPTIDPEEPESWPVDEELPLETNPADWAEQQAELPEDDGDRLVDEPDPLGGYSDEPD